jgi:hypothetical protein
VFKHFSVSQRKFKFVIKLEKIILNKENPRIVFKLNAEDSYLFIHSVFVSTHNLVKNEWNNFLSKVKLTAELRYIVFEDPKGRFIDERKKLFPISFIPDLQQVQPVFHLNTLIKNENFTVGINPELKSYQTLKLELQDFEHLDENYNLEFNIDIFNLKV